MSRVATGVGLVVIVSLMLWIAAAALPAAPMSSGNAQTAADPPLQECQESRTLAREAFFSWFILIFVAVWGVFSVGLLVFYTWWRRPNWIPQMVQEHFIAIVGIPIAALIALCVVLLLRYSAGPIEFSGV
jgi:hypothetical protein